MHIYPFLNRQKLFLDISVETDFKQRTSVKVSQTGVMRRRVMKLGARQSLCSDYVLIPARFPLVLFIIILKYKSQTN